jgi:cytochrome P450
MVAGEANDATSSMLTADPPEHTRLRTPVGKAFSPARMRRLRPRIQQLADELLSALPRRTTVDLLGAYAFPVSATVLCELLGIPAGDRDDFRRWTTAAHTPTYITTAPMPRAEGGRRLRGYVRDLINGSQPAAGLIGELITDRGLTGQEMVETVSHLLLAGQDATTNLIGNGLHALLRHSEQLELLRDKPDLIEPAVEELMRYDGPTARSSPRVAVRDLNLGDVTIPAGSIVIIGLSAANRDPARFTDPDGLDLTRADNQHLALGLGSHFCVAAPLARITGQIAISALLHRFPDIALACRAQELRWRPTPVFRGLTNLPITIA